MTPRDDRYMIMKSMIHNTSERLLFGATLIPSDMLPESGGVIIQRTLTVIKCRVKEFGLSPMRVAMMLSASLAVKVASKRRHAVYSISSIFGLDFIPDPAPDAV